MNQTNLFEKMVKFDNKSRPKTKDDKDKKRNTFDCEGRELTLIAFRSRISLIKEKQEKGLKTLTPKKNA